MQTTFSKTILVALTTLSLAACNQKQESADYTAADVVANSSVATDTVANRQFIRSADAKFGVKDVYNSTQKIEAIVHQNSGFLILSDLQSHETKSEQIEMSEDSLLEIKYFEVENTIQFRVPSVRLDTVLRQIGQLCNYLDYRTIKADEVTFDWQTIDTNTKTLRNHSNRLRQAIDQKGHKLNDITEAEETLFDRTIETNNAQIHGSKLNDDINYSTVKIIVYQPQTVTKSLIANINTTNTQQSPFVFRVTRALATGWFFLQNVIVFFITGWAVWLFLVGSWLVWRRLKHTKKAVFYSPT